MGQTERCRQDGLRDQHSLALIARPDFTIIVMEMLLVGPINHRGRVVSWAVFDRLTIDIEVHEFILPINLSCRPWRDQNLLPGPPVLRIDDEVMDAPIGILHEKVSDVTDLAVAGMDMVPGDCFDASEMRVAVVLAAGNVLLAPPGFRGR